MRIRTMIALTAAPGLLLAGPVAAADSAQAARTASPVAGHEKLADNPWVVWVVGLAVLAAIIIVVTDGDDEPVSP